MRCASDFLKSDVHWTANRGKKTPRKAFLILKSVHSNDEETIRLPRNECSFYREYRHALKDFSRLQIGLYDNRPLSSGALYGMLVRGEVVRDDLIKELSVMEEEDRSLATEMRCLNSGDASLS